MTVGEGTERVDDPERRFVRAGVRLGRRGVLLPEGLCELEPPGSSGVKLGDASGLDFDGVLTTETDVSIASRRGKSASSFLIVFWLIPECRAAVSAAVSSGVVGVELEISENAEWNVAEVASERLEAEAGGWGPGSAGSTVWGFSPGSSSLGLTIGRENQGCVKIWRISSRLEGSFCSILFTRSRASIKACEENGSGQRTKLYRWTATRDRHILLL